MSIRLINLLHSYLLIESYYVAVNSQTYPLQKVTSGVSQGLVLGPLLDLIYPNVVSFAICYSFLLYTNDVKLFKEIHSVNACRLLKSDLCTFSEWCDSDILCLINSKSKVMSISRKTSIMSFPYSVNTMSLYEVYEFSDLGVLFDSMQNVFVLTLNVLPCVAFVLSAAFVGSLENSVSFSQIVHHHMSSST